MSDEDDGLSKEVAKRRQAEVAIDRVEEALDDRDYEAGWAASERLQDRLEELMEIAE